MLPVLDDIQIETSHIHRAEVVHQLIDAVELILVIGLYYLLLQPAGTLDGPAIQSQHRLRIKQIPGGVKPVQVGEQKAGRVAQAAIGVTGALQDLVRDRHLAAVVGRGHPQAQNIGTEGIHHLLRRHHIAP